MWRTTSFGVETTSRIERLVKLLKNEEKRHGNDLNLKQASKDFGGAARELYTTDEETFKQFKEYALQSMGGPVLNEEQQRRRAEEIQRKRREAELEQRRREAEERRRQEAEERLRLEAEERRRAEEGARRRAAEQQAREADAEKVRRWATELDDILGNDDSRTSRREEPVERTVEETVSSPSGGTHFSFSALGTLILSFGGIALLGLIPFLLLQFGIYLWDDHWFWALVVWFLALCSIGFAFYGWLAWAAILIPLWICTTSWWWLGALIYLCELIWLYNACQEED